MTAPNTKASKLERILKRVTEIAAKTETVEELTATNQMLAATTRSLEAESARLRKYLGSILFARRQASAQLNAAEERLEPYWRNRRNA